VRDRTAALIEEQKILGLTYQEQEKRRMALDLEQTALADLREEARRKGVTDLESIQLSAAHRAKIDEASSAYARQADVLHQLEEAQHRADDASREFYDGFKSSVMDAITGAKSLGEALRGLAKQFGSMLLSRGMDQLFQPSTGGDKGGLLGGIFKSIGGLFRATGGPVVKGQPYIVGENRPEMFVPDQNGKIVPRVPTMPQFPDASQMRGSSGAVSAPVSISIDATGADAAGLARVQQEIAALKSSLPSAIVETVKDAYRRRKL